MTHQGFASRTRAQKRYYHKNKSQGKCVSCGSKAEEGKIKCIYHLKKQKEAEKRRRNKK